MPIENWFLERARVTSKRHRRVTLDDRMTFFQQLSSLVSSGTPLLESLQICAEQSSSTKLQEILEDVAAQVAAGSSLQAAMTNHPSVFEAHWTALIGTGEISGRMDQVLADLNQQVRETRATMRKISGALIYPFILLVVAILVVVVMLWFVVPTFAEMFAEMNAQLPGITLYVIRASDFVADYGLYALALLTVGGFALRQYIRTERGRRRFSAFGLSLPIVGDLMVQAAMYRFSSNLSLLLRSGVPILDTLSALSAVFRTNPVYRDAIVRVQHRVAAGWSLAESLEESRLFTSMMTNMAHIGEESAQLAHVMEQIAPYYREKMDSLIGRVTKLLEPGIIIVMGFTIAIVMLAIYIPMFEMSGKIQ